MFKLLRYFSLTSAVATLLITAVLAFTYWQIESSRLTNQVKHENATLAKSVANVIWPAFREFVKSEHELEPDQLRARPEIVALSRRLKSIISGLPVIKVKMYEPNGLTVYSSNYAEIGSSKSADAGFKAAVSGNEVLANLDYRETFGSIRGQLTDINLIESYVPIAGADGQVEGVFELYTDVTHQIVEIRENTVYVILALLAGLGVLYVALYHIVHRADAIIKEQYAGLHEKVSEAETETARAMAQLREAIEAIEDGFVLYDAEDRIVIFNQKYMDIYSLHNDAFKAGALFEDLLRYAVAQGEFDLSDEDTEAWIENRIQRHRNPGAPMELKLANGRWLRISERRTKDGGIVGVRTDITEHKLAEAELLEARDQLEVQVAQRTEELQQAVERLSAEIAEREKTKNELEKTENTLLEVIQESPVAVGITDQEGKFQFWNSLFFRMGQQIVTDSGSSEFRISFRQPDTYAGLYDKLHAGGAIINQEVELLDSEGGDAWGLLSMQNIEFEGENAILTWIYDITDLKLQEAELTAARIEAENANRSKSDFLAQMSHEIRTPMNGVMSMADLLSLTPLSKEQAEMNSVVYESSKALLTIINDILDFSKIEAGKIEIEKASFSVTALAEGVAELLAPMATGKGLEFLIYVDPEVPDHLEGDPVRVRQVLTNLLSNAIKFTEQGRVFLNVSLIEATDETASLRFTMKDTGIGMTEGQLDKLFRPFEQADSTITRRFGGTGLGLTISRRLINLMGGDIQVESQFGKGSTFSFDLDFAKRVEKRQLMNYDLKGIHIIAVAANPDTGSILQRYMEYLGAQCTVTESYDATLSLVDKMKAANRRVDGIFNLDAPCNVFCSTALEADKPSWEANEIPLICAGMHPAGDQFEKELESDDIITVSRPYKREMICQTIAKAVGRFDDGQIIHDYQRLDDGPMDVTYRAPDNETARESGALILVAEDNLTNQTVIRLLMDKLGLVGDIASDGAEALQRYKDGNYGLLLTDCHMPVMDGYQLAREVRKLEEGTDARLPIIALTADALTGTEQRCLDAGMDDFLSKPVDRSELNQVILKWLPQIADLRAAERPTSEVKQPSPAATDAQMPEELAVLDMSYFRDLVGGADDMLAPLLQEYLETTKPTIDELVATLRSRDFDAARKAAHAGAGASKTAGAMQLADICGTIERVIVEEDAEKALTYIDDLEPAYARVAEKVNAL